MLRRSCLFSSTGFLICCSCRAEKTFACQADDSDLEKMVMLLARQPSLHEPATSPHLRLR